MKEHIEVLDKGLHFAPDSNFDLFTTLLDVNRFVRTLTVKKTILQDDASIIDADSNKSFYSAVINKIEGLSYKDQVSLMTFHRLGYIKDYAIEVQISCMKITNPGFYPLKSRVPPLDIFQSKMEQGLLDFDIANNFADGHICNNLTRLQREVLKSFKENNNLVLYSNPTALFKSKLETLLQEGLSLGVITQQEFKFMLPSFPVVPTKRNFFHHYVP